MLSKSCLENQEKVFNSTIRNKMIETLRGNQVFREPCEDRRLIDILHMEKKLLFLRPKIED